MSNYTKAVDFAAKDGLSSGDPDKLIKGTEHDNEYNAIQTAVNSKSDANDGTHTGTAGMVNINASGTLNVGGEATFQGKNFIQGTDTSGFHFDSVLTFGTKSLILRAEEGAAEYELFNIDGEDGNHTNPQGDHILTVGDFIATAGDLTLTAGSATIGGSLGVDSVIRTNNAVHWGLTTSNGMQIDSTGSAFQFEYINADSIDVIGTWGNTGLQVNDGITAYAGLTVGTGDLTVTAGDLTMTAGGISIPSTEYLSFGDTDGLQIRHISSQNYINLEVGDLNIRDDIGTNLMVIYDDGAVSIPNGTLTVTEGVTSNGPFEVGAEVIEAVHNMTGTVIDPANGTMQYKTLSANTTLTQAINIGESVNIMIINGDTYTITWPSISWVGGVAPAFATTGFVVLWKYASVLYGMHLGNL